MTSPLCAIVGVGPGVSLAVARRFAREGFSIALMARTLNRVEEYAQLLRDEGAEAHAYQIDVASPASVADAFIQVEERQEAPDVLVYNPSIYREVLPSQLDPEVLVHDFRINAVGALSCVQAVLPTMRTRKTGKILITGGGSALNPLPLHASLGIGKAAVRNLAFSLHAELLPKNIHVGTVTIDGAVSPDTRFNPTDIAEAFWTLYQQPAGQWEREIMFE
ncbi:Short-chain dehydrogenase [Catalinimonas alkaloidigena]|uniref:Short-chain dehydrogenase n=1 Tax=Catalinimonas alkaloidigena TaxID=1075417 RepID=A0A1G9PGT2_9BACT|nr:SDR family NAD(P)-dependent oxidoreductase [Catalinimonas alkaloidigena]SDL97970.1 Short-chain dehydrogenase [Catalinimonas alkaloidigena]